jgi:excisionase family DNA binding protein
MSEIDEDEHTALLDAEPTEDGRYRPTVHVLMSDGRVTEFKNRCLLIPEQQGFDTRDHAANSIYAVLVNGKGEQLYDAETDEPAIVPVPPLALRFDPEHLETYRQAAERAAVSKSTIKRAISAGELPVVKVGKQHPRIRKADLDCWIGVKKSRSGR